MNVPFNSIVWTINPNRRVNFERTNRKAKCSVFGTNHKFCPWKFLIFQGLFWENAWAINYKLGMHLNGELISSSLCVNIVHRSVAYWKQQALSTSIVFTAETLLTTKFMKNKRRECLLYTKSFCYITFHYYRLAT